MYRLSVICFAIIMINGCGGSSGTPSTASQTPQPSPVPQPAPSTFTVSAGVTVGGSISPMSISVENNVITEFTLAPNSGFQLNSVSGCNGTLSGLIYTTSPVTEDCAVTANFEAIPAPSFTVNAAASNGGVIFPASQTILENNTAMLTLTPNTNFAFDSVSGCAGSLHNNSYQTGAVTNNCSINATFAAQEQINTLFVPFYFSEDGAASTPYTTQATKALIEEGNNAIKPFFLDASYGKSNIVPTYAELYEITRAKSAFQDEDPLGYSLTEYALEIVEANTEFENYDMVVLLLPPLDQGYPVCSALQGKQTLEVNATTYSFRYVYGAGNDFSCYHRNLLVHEIGHAFGGGHSSTIACETLQDGTVVDLHDPISCDANNVGTYYATGDRYGIQGSYRGHPNLYWKRASGMLLASQISVLTSSNSVKLDSYEAVTNGDKGIQIPLIEQTFESESSYWIEYRTEPVIDLTTGDVNSTTEQVQVRLNIPQVTDQFNQVQRDGTIRFVDSALESSMILSNVGDFFHDSYRGIKVTWSAQQNKGELKQSDVMVDISKIELSSTISSMTEIVSFTNNESAELTISSVAILGRGAGDFTITDDQCSLAILPSEGQCTVSISKASINPSKAAIVFSNNDLLRGKASYSLFTQ